MTAIETQGLVDEAGRHDAAGRALHDGGDGEAGEDVDGAELVHLANALELADVKAVEADELARTTAGQAEPEGLVLRAASGTTNPVVAAAMAAALPAAGPSSPARGPPGAFARSTWRWRTPGHRADRRGCFGHRGLAPALGHQGLEPVEIGHVLPLVAASARDAEDSAGLRHVARPLGVVQHGDASLVDDLCWGHGDGLLGSVEGTTESIAGPLKGVDVQPHVVDWKH